MLFRSAEKAEADQGRLLPVDFLEDHLIRRIGVRLIEHYALVACLLEDRREGHDADGREAHDSDTTVFCAGFCRERVKLRITDMDEKYSQTNSLVRLQPLLSAVTKQKDAIEREAGRMKK